MVSICIKENNIALLDNIASEINIAKLDDIKYSKHSFKLYNNIIVHYIGENNDVFFDFISGIISKTIISFYEEKIIKRLINFDYFYFDKNDKKIIFDEYKILIDKISEFEKEQKFALIYGPLRSFIKSNKSVVLEGFINFKLKEYTEYLKALLQEAVNQFILDKEYIEFVNLLKEYVDSRVPDEKLVNLIYVGNEALLLSEEGNLIDLEVFDSKYLSDITFCNNDYVLNTLVGLIPYKINLHLISPKDNFIKTIELIFGDKVVYCQGCNLCSAYKILNLK